MIGEKQNGDKTAAARRLRRARSLQRQQRDTLGSHSTDLPVFLANPNLSERFSEEEPTSRSDFRHTLSSLSTGLIAALTPRYLAAKAKLNSLREHSRSLPHLWQRESVREQAARIALIALVAPLALLAMPGRAPQQHKNASHSAQEPILQPSFDLEKRLAFAQGLRDRLLSHAIALSLKSPTSSEPKPNGAGAPADTPLTEVQKPTGHQAVSDAGTLLMPQVATDDRRWTLPFDSQTYTPADLPITSSGSFRAETAMSDLVSEKTRRPSVAENDEQTVAPAPRGKLERSSKRKKAIAEKRRLAQTGQVTATAAAQPTIAQQEPNLPPPPILFFLGAPPPQPTQPIQAPPAALPPPSSPPTNNSWVPNSISDAFKNAY